MTLQPSTAEVFRRATYLMQAGEIDQWLALFHDDVVFEFPFAPPGAPRRLEGKEALTAHVTGRAARRLAAPRVENLTVHQSVDPTTLVAEMTVRGEGGAERPAIAVVSVREGRITLYRDYWNPLDVINGKQ
ncbi:nuclear transport factor 2 family protein [Pseudonocardia spinosispora]|uniref:nuclear transport factor 2 family protein n=1 Tax=Pseudonocardia spinosispora TaxID=103441 RepID=UPI0003F66A12|nr:nuclear transport factor 2 family protein [Pseudonocardia spinosispora]